MKALEIKPELKKFLHSPASSSHDKRLKELKKLDSIYPEKELGLEYWIVANKLHTEGGKPEDIISVGKRALNVLIYDEDCEIPCFSNSNANTTSPKTHGKLLLISSILNILGFACSALRRFDECLSYLTWSNRNLSKLKEDSSSCNSCVLQVLHVNQVRLFELKMIHLGRRDEAAVHMRKVLDIKEKTLEEDCVELGQVNRDVVYAYLEIDDYKQALPHCLKALEIYTKHLGQNAKEVLQIRRELGGIYNELGEYDKALEQTQLSQRGSRSKSSSSDRVKSEIGEALILLDAGRDDEAVPILKAVASNGDVEVGQRATALISMARALLNLGKRVEAKKCMEQGHKMLERKDVNLVVVAAGFQNMSILYEKMNDFETAISLMRRVLRIPDVPQQLVVDGYKRLFSLISKSGMEIQGIPYFEDAVKLLKERLGPQNLDVGYGYASLGEAYMTLGRPEPAAKSLKSAKAIMDVFLGPHHPDSLKTSQSLHLAYANMGRYAEAIECQEKIVESLNGLGPSEVDHLAEATSLLALMKVKAARAVGESRHKIKSEILDSLARASSQPSHAEEPNDLD